MFDDLDDDGLHIDTSFRNGVHRRGRTLRRQRTARRTGLVMAPLALLAVVVGWAQSKANDIDRVQIDVTGPPPGPGDPIDVLVVGTDGGLLDGAEPSTDQARADAILLIRLDPASDAVRILTIPRDLWVVQPDGSNNRMAQLRATYGAQGLVDGVEQVFAAEGEELSIDHYVELDTGGLTGLADLVGGVPVATETAIRDTNSGVALDAGCHILDGHEVVALSRARNLELQDASGWWSDDPTSDFGRQSRNVVLAEGLARALFTSDVNIGDGPALLDLAADHATIDADLDTREIVEWTRWGSTLPADAVVSTGLPTSPMTTPGGAAVLETNDQVGSALRWWSDGTFPGPDDTIVKRATPLVTISLPPGNRCP